MTTSVFKSRLDLMKKNIRNGKYFGGREIIYTFHVIEYQFRGLPHAHIVVPLSDVPDFCGCTSLRKIVIPPAVRRIKDQAFDGCMIVTNTVDATI